MHIVVKANSEQRTTFLSKKVPDEVWLTFLNDEETVPGADVYFDLLFEEKGAAFGNINDKPVFVNAVSIVGNELPDNCIRINAWNGFLERDIIEIAVKENAAMLNEVEKILQSLQWKYQITPDEPGMISARIIAMIINEAYFGLGDDISSKAEIDIAMKLGTNYPYGPFEWAEKIGLKNIYSLLEKLSKQNSRYAVAPSLQKEIASL